MQTIIKSDQRTRSPETRDTVDIARQLAELVPDWTSQRSEVRRAKNDQDLPAMKAVAERIARDPKPPALAESERARICIPVDRKRAVVFWTVILAPFGGSRSDEEFEACLRANLESTIELGLSEADLMLINRWFRTSPGEPGRPEELPVMRFRPTPSECHATMLRAQSFNRYLVSEYDERRKVLEYVDRFRAELPALEAAKREREIAAQERFTAEAAELARVLEQREVAARAKREQHDQLQADIDAAVESGELEKCLRDLWRRWKEVRDDPDWCERRAMVLDAMRLMSSSTLRGARMEEKARVDALPNLLRRSPRPGGRAG